MPAISTKKCKVQIDGVTLLANKWTVEIHADEIDVTTFESGGFAEYLASYVDAMVTVDAFWDPDDNPFANAPDITVANELSEVKLFLRRAEANDCFVFPTLVVLSCVTDAVVRDAIRFNFTGRNKGVFYYPGNVVFSGITE